MRYSVNILSGWCIQNRFTLFQWKCCVTECDFKIPVAETVKPKKKNIMSRPKANSAAQKQRSTSAEEQITSDSNSKLSKVTKSLESVMPDKRVLDKEIIKSPAIRFDSSRLRVPVEKSPIELKAGDRYLAQWTDSKKFPAVARQLHKSKY